MPEHKAYYSIIQFCPDRSRAEGANIGVILLCPDLGFVDVKTARGNDRVRRFFGSEAFDKQRLTIIKRAIETRVREKYDWSRGLEDLERFIGTRANDIQLTHPRSLKTANPAEEIDVLFHELVGGRSRAEAASAPIAPLFPKLDHALRAPGIRERIRFDEQVTVPVVRKRIDVPYVYENGVINLVKPYQFSGTPDRATRTAAELAIEGDLLARHSVGNGTDSSSSQIFRKRFVHELKPSKGSSRSTPCV